MDRKYVIGNKYVVRMEAKYIIRRILFLVLLFATIICAFNRVSNNFVSKSIMTDNCYADEFVVATNLSEVSIIEETIEIGTVEAKAEVKEVISDDLYWLSKIVYAESRGEDDKGQQLVAEVVINRLNHPNFPDTIKDIIFEGNGKQFQPVVDGSINLEPDERAIANARKVLEDGPTLTTEDILYFHSKSLGKGKVGTKWWKGVYTAFVHDGHVFAKEIPEN